MSEAMFELSCHFIADVLLGQGTKFIVTDALQLRCLCCTEWSSPLGAAHDLPQNGGWCLLNWSSDLQFDASQLKSPLTGYSLALHCCWCSAKIDSTTWLSMGLGLQEVTTFVLTTWVPVKPEGIRPTGVVEICKQLASGDVCFRAWFLAGAIHGQEYLLSQTNRQTALHQHPFGAL